MTTRELAESFLDFRNKKQAEKQEKIPMTTDYKKGICECCGEDKPLKINHLKMVCGNCISVRGAINLRTQSVVDSLREIKGPMPQWLNDQELSQVEELISSQHLQKAKELENQLKENNHDRIELILRNKELEEKLQGLSEEFLRFKNETSNVPITGELAEENEALRTKISDLENQIIAMSASAIIGESLSFDDPGTHVDKAQLSQVVMAIGQSIIEHNCKIPKVHFRALRKLAA